MSKKAIIIGAGPAGLTAAYELLKSTDIKPVIIEKSGDIGGISKTINYKGNRMDIGGHRFFSKSDRVMNWWLNIMPIQKTEETYTTITYQRKQRTIVQEETHLHANPDDKLVMLVRKRLSRIYFLRKFFTYPIQLSIDTLRKLGLFRTISILLSYLYAQLIPRKPEKSLEDFLINRFGRQLYLLFFKDYTEKVWGVPCNEISAEWGAQRIKGVSISKAIQHAAQTMFKKNKKGSTDISQKDTETSLIEQFLYPALGPGQLWEEVARQIQVLGGTILMNQDVKEINISNENVNSVVTVNSVTGEKTEHQGDYFFSTMPVQELIAGINGQVPENVQHIAAGLQYRDFITVGVLLQKTKSLDLKDTWIYIQEKDVKVGRLQLFNNWSPYMVNKPGTQWIGMEYFCNQDDDFWNLTDDEIKRIAIHELEKMGLAQVQDVLDSTVHRVEKTYPAYFGTYNQFDKIRSFVDQIENLFLVGRNGMHKYNNADHSMLTAMTAVDNIRAGITSKENIWAINTEQEYHEEKASMQTINANEKDNNNDNSHFTNGRLNAESSIYSADQTRRNNNQTPANTYTESVISFTRFLFNNKRHKIYFYCAAIAIIIEFAVFKYFYPFASFINGDSFVYIETAFYNWSINTYPVGYSNFLRVFSAFTKSDTVLVGFQYLSLQLSLLTLLYTIYYFYKPSKIAQIFLLIFLVLNPVFLYLCNYVSSDALFITLSLAWFTMLVWIIHRPNNWLILTHALVLFMLFTIRYNALFYPFISSVAFLVSKLRWRQTVYASALSVVLIGLFILHTSDKYYKFTGQRQFSPFSGWQIANNALYAYRYIDSADRKPVPTKFQDLHTLVNHYFDTTRDIVKNPQETLIANTMYMWDKRSPLQIYMLDKHRNDSTWSIFKKWSVQGPLFAEYGATLIKQYPVAFLKHYLWPNTMKFYAPPVEFLEKYSTGKDSVTVLAQAWFDYKSQKITSRFKDFNVSILDFLPYLTGSLNVLFLIGLVFYLLLDGHRHQRWMNKGLAITVVFWFANFAFSVFASPIALRFQLFNTILCIVFGTIFIDFIGKIATRPQPEKSRLAESEIQLT